MTTKVKRKSSAAKRPTTFQGINRSTPGQYTGMYMDRIEARAKKFKSVIDGSDPNWFIDKFQLKREGRTVYKLSDLRATLIETDKMGQAAINPTAVTKILTEGNKGLLSGSGNPLFEDILVGTTVSTEEGIGDDSAPIAIVGGRHRLTAIITFVEALGLSQKEIDNTLIEVFVVEYSDESERNKAVLANNGSRVVSTGEKITQKLVETGVDVSTANTIKNAIPTMKYGAWLKAFQAYSALVIGSDMPQSLVFRFISVLWTDLKDLEGFTEETLRRNKCKELFKLFEAVLANMPLQYNSYLSENKITSIPTKDNQLFFECLGDYIFEEMPEMETFMGYLSSVD
jgi:hypothetical protein